MAPLVREVSLTERELEVLIRISHGDTNVQIAARLKITEDTVKSHVRRMVRRLMARDRTHLARIGIECGVVPIGPPAVRVKIVPGRRLDRRSRAIGMLYLDPARARSCKAVAGALGWKLETTRLALEKSVEAGWAERSTEPGDPRIFYKLTEAGIEVARVLAKST